LTKSKKYDIIYRGVKMIRYRITRKLFDAIRKPDKNTCLTVTQVMDILNATAGFKEKICGLDIID